MSNVFRDVREVGRGGGGISLAKEWWALVMGLRGRELALCELDRQDVEIGIRWRYIDEVKAMGFVMVSRSYRPSPVRQGEAEAIQSQGSLSKSK